MSDNNRHLVVLDRVSTTPKMIFFGFKETTMKKGVVTNFNSQMWSTKYASVGDLRAKFEDVLKQAQAKFGFAINAANGKVTFEDPNKPVLLEDLLPEFRNINPAVVYKYITAEEYEELSEQERKSYQPCVVPRTSFYQTNEDTGEIMRDENGRAIVLSEGAGYFTNAIGNILFRRSAIGDAKDLEQEEKMVVKKLDADALSMLDEYPNALEAIEERIKPAEDEQQVADDLTV